MRPVPPYRGDWKVKAVGKFRHPHLVRGTVHTPMGAFVITRGIIEVPDDIGQLLGWVPITGDGQPAAAAPKAVAVKPAVTSGGVSRHRS
jgi:hypothetical protein